MLEFYLYIMLLKIPATNVQKSCNAEQGTPFFSWEL